ncbi:MAG: hypothetical protein NC299_03265 [Lachnospiraceae bacterium]|nr:hypothetical protein [Ruminococcus sp.]MCM1274368.1 hypothetical protein [Lachnospiraceae bacterium]
MSDDKYSIDDILKEVDTLRTDEDRPKSTFDGSVTDIIGGNEIDRAIRTGSQKKRSEKAPKPDLSVTSVINSIPAKNRKERPSPFAARQRTEEEFEERVAGDISDAIDNRPEKPHREDAPLAAKQRTEEEVSERIAKEISEAADIKIWERLREEDDEMDEEGVRTYNPHAEEEYEDGGEYDEDSDDDEIVFQEPGSLVTTDTMQLRKQRKIEEINRALLKVDSETESPDDMLSSLNPMESRAKAAEQLKGDVDENTDTLAVGGNDLKRIASRGEEKIKEYRPAAARKKDAGKADDVLFSAAGAQRAAFPGGLHVGESIVDALNKKIQEEKEEAKAEEQSEKTEISEDTQSGKINIIASAPEEPEPEPEEETPADKIKQANELAQKKKRKIANFILEDMGGDTEELERSQARDEDDDDEEEDIEEPVDLDDENVIRDRLSRAAKGLASRFFILLLLFAATLFIAIVNKLKLNLGGLSNFISYRLEPQNYLYTHLTIGILSFAACSSVISNGLSRLFKLRPDGDTLCALAHVSAIAAMVPYLSAGQFIQLGYSHIYLAVSLLALIFNTLSKLFTVRTAQKNFAFVSAKDRAKFFVERCDGDGAEQLAKGAVTGMPVVASMRKTEMLCDFILSTYCEDVSDRFSRKITPITIAAAVIGGVVAYFTCGSNITMNNVSWAITVCTAIFALGAAFSGSMVVTLPMLRAAGKSGSAGSVILGYNAVEDLSDANAVLVEAKSLFPPSSVKINNICGYDKPKNRCEGKINIDEAIIYAASLAVASDSVLADAFFNMLNYKQELLKHVSGCIYENNLGVMGWIDRRRVLLGTRQHMKSHEITVPNNKKEAAANVNNDEVIYLAVGGEVCLLFFVQLTANPAVKSSVQELAYNDVSLVIKTVDGMITADYVTELFEIDADNVKILPFEAHESFNEHTKFVSSGSAAVSCSGTFTSFADSVTTARSLRSASVLGCIMQGAGIALGILLALIFILFVKSGDEVYNKTLFGLFNVFNILIYNLIWGAIALGVQFFKRI